MKEFFKDMNAMLSKYWKKLFLNERTKKLIAYLMIAMVVLFGAGKITETILNIQSQNNPVQNETFITNTVVVTNTVLVSETEPSIQNDADTVVVSVYGTDVVATQYLDISEDRFVEASPRKVLGWIIVFVGVVCLAIGIIGSTIDYDPEYWWSLIGTGIAIFLLIAVKPFHARMQYQPTINEIAYVQLCLDNYPRDTLKSDEAERVVINVVDETGLHSEIAKVWYFNHEQTQVKSIDVSPYGEISINAF